MGINTYVEIMVPPHKFADFADIIKALEIRAEIIINDLQEYDK